jgi:hypothetical protein
VNDRLTVREDDRRIEKEIGRPTGKETALRIAREVVLPTARENVRRSEGIGPPIAKEEIDLRTGKGETGRPTGATVLPTDLEGIVRHTGTEETVLPIGKGDARPTVAISPRTGARTARRMSRSRRGAMSDQGCRILDPVIAGSSDQKARSGSSRSSGDAPGTLPELRGLTISERRPPLERTPNRRNN